MFHWRPVAGIGTQFGADKAIHVAKSCAKNIYVQYIIIIGTFFVCGFKQRMMSNAFQS